MEFLDPIRSRPRSWAGDKFEYQPLDASHCEIRLLTVAPGLWQDMDDRLICTIRHVSLNGRRKNKSNPVRPKYDTISYVWGDATQRDYIFLNRVLFEVPRSSEQVLRRLRLPHKYATFWIDANLIYLGEAPERMESALESMSSILEIEIADAIKDGSTFVDIMTHPDGAPRFDDTGLTITVDTEALAEFYSSPWFSRLWVLQEMALAKQNICFYGHHCINLESTLMVAAWLVFKSVRLCGLYYEATANMFNHLRTPHSLYQRWKAGLVNLLVASAKPSICTDPRDKVYALIGLLDWSEYGGLPEELRPDYSRSVADVLGLAGSWAIRSGALNITATLLGSIAHRPDEDILLDGLPSWIPRWHRHFDPVEESQSFRESQLRTMTDARSVVASKETDQGLRFTWTVQGIILGVLEDVHTGLQGSFPWEDFPQHYIIPTRQILFGYDCHEDVDNALCKILTASTWGDAGPLSDHHLQLLRAWLRENMSQSPPFSYETSHAAECSTAIFYACSNRVVGKLQGGKPVLAPRVTAKDDIVVWINNSGYPTVFRRCGEEYEVIGDAYVYGTMDGEAIEAWKESGEELQTFVLT